MSKSQEKRLAIQQGIPPATEDDLKLDLEKAYLAAQFCDPVDAMQSMVRLAAHHKQEAGDAGNRAYDHAEKCALAEIRITTLEAALQEAHGDIHGESCGDSDSCYICRALTQTEKTPDD